MMPKTARRVRLWVGLACALVTGIAGVIGDMRWATITGGVLAGLLFGRLLDAYIDRERQT